MSEFRARIGRVRMKNGGADVVVFDRKPVNLDGEDYRGTIVANARRIAEGDVVFGKPVISEYCREGVTGRH